MDPNNCRLARKSQRKHDRRAMPHFCDVLSRELVVQPDLINHLPPGANKALQRDAKLATVLIDSLSPGCRCGQGRGFNLGRRLTSVAPPQQAKLCGNDIRGQDPREAAVGNDPQERL